MGARLRMVYDAEAARLSKFSRYIYERYIGKVKCPVCGKDGYEEEGRIMGSVVRRIAHRTSINGRLVYSGVCYA